MFSSSSILFLSPSHHKIEQISFVVQQFSFYFVHINKPQTTNRHRVPTTSNNLLPQHQPKFERIQNQHHSFPFSKKHKKNINNT